MNDQGRHCPFLNRSDARCSKHFSLDQLGHAFEYCFGYYEGCGVYLQLLAERRVRRAHASVGGGGGAFDGAARDGGNPEHPFYEKLTQLTVAGRLAEPGVAAGAAHVSHAPRV